MAPRDKTICYRVRIGSAPVENLVYVCIVLFLIYVILMWGCSKLRLLEIESLYQLSTVSTMTGKHRILHNQIWLAFLVEHPIHSSTRCCFR